MNEKKPLYRKVNTRTYNVHHNYGSDAKHDRNTKQGLSKSMKKDKQRGLDYTPLYKFLLSKIGKKWDDVYSEAVSRLPKGDTEPIYYLFDDEREIVRIGESSYYSALKVDDNGLIQKVSPNTSIEHIHPACPCCTHTFNGNVVTNKYKSDVN